MSISDEIRRLVADGQLFQIRPLAVGAAEPRALFVSKELNELLTAEMPSVADVERIARLEAHLAHFVEGGVVEPRYMCLLKRPARDVLEIRSRRPRPSVRVFGRFAAVDVFIALNASLREPLGPFGSREWRDAVVRCGALWRQLFLTFPPLKGTSLHDFISENVYDQHEFG